MGLYIVPITIHIGTSPFFPQIINVFKLLMLGLLSLGTR